ncbi:MAG TPA: hypothetical protein VGF90_01965, partial [Verrucomicrobiae bacterium]
MKNPLRALLSTLVLSTLVFASNAAEMVIESIDGPVTKKEIETFKEFMKAQPTSDHNTHNAWVYGNAGKDTEALGMVYEITRDPEILDQMIR